LTLFCFFSHIHSLYDIGDAINSTISS
jgi:hypothetical protein